MKKSTKAALLSAFAFPGIGHMYLRRYISGLILIGASLFGLYPMIATTLESALQIVEKIQGGSGQPDVAAIADAVAGQLIETGSGAHPAEIASAIFIICWIIGIIDSYRIGHAQEKNKVRVEI